MGKWGKGEKEKRRKERNRWVLRNELEYKERHGGWEERYKPLWWFTVEREREDGKRDEPIGINRVDGKGEERDRLIRMSYYTDRSIRWEERDDYMSPVERDKSGERKGGGRGRERISPLG